MKRLLFSIAMVLSIISSAQVNQVSTFPNFQQFGSSTTWTRINGIIYAFKGIVHAEYADTTAANAEPFLRFSRGAVIRVGNNTYMRDITATRWILQGAGGGSINLGYGLVENSGNTEVDTSRAGYVYGPGWMIPNHYYLDSIRRDGDKNSVGHFLNVDKGFVKRKPIALGNTFMFVGNSWVTGAFSTPPFWTTQITDSFSKTRVVQGTNGDDMDGVIFKNWANIRGRDHDTTFFVDVAYLPPACMTGTLAGLNINFHYGRPVINKMYQWINSNYRAFIANYYLDDDWRSISSLGDPEFITASVSDSLRGKSGLGAKGLGSFSILKPAGKTSFVLGLYGADSSVYHRSGTVYILSGADTLYKKDMNNRNSGNHGNSRYIKKGRNFDAIVLQNLPSAPATITVGTIGTDTVYFDYYGYLIPSDSTSKGLFINNIPYGSSSGSGLYYTKGVEDTANMALSDAVKEFDKYPVFIADLNKWYRVNVHGTGHPSVAGNSLIASIYKNNIITSRYNEVVSNSSFNVGGYKDTIYILASGQSNGNGINLGNYDTASNPKVFAWNYGLQSWGQMRRMTDPMGMVYPYQSRTGQYDSATSSVFYLAKRLQEKTGLFVKVLNLSWDGQSINEWLSGFAGDNFAIIDTMLKRSATPRIDYFLWQHGETDAVNNMSDTAYKSRFDRLISRFDSTGYMKPYTPILLITPSYQGANMRDMVNIMKAMGSGIYDKRYTLIDAGKLPTIDAFHLTARAQSDVADSIMQIMYNKASLHRHYVFSASERDSFLVHAPIVGAGVTVRDSITSRLYESNGTQFNVVSGIANGNATTVDQNGGRVNLGGTLSNNTLIQGTTGRYIHILDTAGAGNGILYLWGKTTSLFSGILNVNAFGRFSAVHPLAYFVSDGMLANDNAIISLGKTADGTSNTGFLSYQWAGQNSGANAWKMGFATGVNPLSVYAANKVHIGGSGVPNQRFQVTGSGRFTDTLWATTMATNDSSDVVATTKWVKQQAYGTGGGGSTPDLQTVTDEGATTTNDISVPDEAYNAGTWNGNNEVPTKNAIRDKIESMGGGTPGIDDVLAQAQTLIADRGINLGGKNWSVYDVTKGVGIGVDQADAEASTTIGDVNNVGNGTKIVVDDANQKIYFRENSLPAASIGFTWQLVNLTTGEGKWALDATGSAAEMEVGVSAVESGTSTRVLYNNAGVLGEYPVSGTGSVAMTASPTFTGTPAAPTASAGTNTTQVATTAFVIREAGTTVILGSDVPSSASTSSQDITGLSWSATSGVLYEFEAMILYTASDPTIGVNLGLNGPGSPTLVSFTGHIPQAATAIVGFSRPDYSVGSGSNATPGSIGTAWVRGFVQNSSSGTVILRFSPETATASGIVIKAGSRVKYWVRN